MEFFCFQVARFNAGNFEEWNWRLGRRKIDGNAKNSWIAIAKLLFQGNIFKKKLKKTFNKNDLQKTAIFMALHVFAKRFKNPFYAFNFTFTHFFGENSFQRPKNHFPSLKINFFRFPSQIKMKNGKQHS